MESVGDLYQGYIDTINYFQRSVPTRAKRMTLEDSTPNFQQLGICMRSI